MDLQDALAGLQASEVQPPDKSKTASKAASKPQTQKSKAWHAARSRKAGKR